MLANTGFNLDYTKWPPEAWAVAAGLIPIALFVVAYFFLMRRRKTDVRAPYTPPPIREAPAPADDPFVFGSSQERRSSLRRGGNPVPIFLSDAEARSDPTPGWVVDRSMGGLCVSVEEPVATGTILSVRAANAPNTIPWIQVEVRNCRATEDRYELGCQFVRTPPWSTLLLFG
jgi:hypothetical protein